MLHVIIVFYVMTFALASQVCAQQIDPITPQENYTPDQVDYFLEVALGSEFGDSSLIVKKWVSDIKIKVIGSPTNEDRMTLNRVMEEINAIIGRPKLKIDDQNPNIEIYFVPESDFSKYEPNYVPENLGFFWVWWNDSFEITRARIMISTDPTLKERPHLIREELTQILGLMNDSWTYEESIFYQGWSGTTEYAEIDKVIIDMLYREEISPGMTGRQVEEILSSLKPTVVSVEKAPTVEQTPHSLTKVSGDGQEGAASTQLTAPFVVLVLDQDGSPLAGAVVTFSVIAGEGSLSSTTATTDANGRARSTLTLGPEPGTNTIAATVEGLRTATFTATADEPTSDSQEDPEPDPQLESLSVTIDDVTSATERGRMTFSVRLEPTPTAPTAVKYATASQTATAGQDYEAAAGTLHFGANQNTATFIVRIRPDEQDEPDETFAVRITHPSTGALLAEATGTITDDDGATPPEADSDSDDEMADGEEADGEMAFAFSGEVEDQAYTAGTAISALVLPEAVGGEGEITYRVSGLPAGLSFDAATRTISGTPEAVTDGAVEVTYTAQDSAGSAVTLTFSITVNPALSFGDLFDLLGSGKRAALPDRTQLLQNAPNPFNSQTVLSYFLAGPGRVRLEVFALSGQRVAVLHQGTQEAGYHRLHWNGRDDAGHLVASGTYLYRLVTDEGALTRKLVLLR